MENSKDPDQTPRSVASDLDLHRPNYLNNVGKYHFHAKYSVFLIPYYLCPKLSNLKYISLLVNVS